MRRVAALALGAAACSGQSADLAAASAALQGGAIDADRATVAIVTHRSGVATLCSGSLIAPNVVVTARHCVAQAPPTTIQCGATPLGLTVSPQVVFVTTELTTDHSLPDDAGAAFTISSIETAPGGDDSCGFDLSLLVLSSPVTNATPYTPSFSTPKAGDPYSALGYGETCGDATNELCYLESGARRRLDGLVVVCAADCSGFEIASTEWAGQKGLCPGDSGGPAFDAAGHLIGFALRGQIDPNGNCTAPVYAAVAPWKSLLVAAVRSASTAAGIAAPAWTLDAPDTDRNALDSAEALDSANAVADAPLADAPLADAAAEPSPEGAAGAAPVPLPEPPQGDQGCACSVAPGVPGATPFGALIVAAALFRTTRRRRAGP